MREEITIIFVHFDAFVVYPRDPCSCSMDSLGGHWGVFFGIVTLLSEAKEEFGVWRNRIERFVFHQSVFTGRGSGNPLFWDDASRLRI